MEAKGMSLRSKRAPQLTEVFKYEAKPQDIQVNSFSINVIH